MAQRRGAARFGVFGHLPLGLKARQHGARRGFGEIHPGRRIVVTAAPKATGLRHFKQQPTDFIRLQPIAFALG
jgi:hypothetical protein